MWSSHSIKIVLMKYIKLNEVLIHTMTWMNLKIIMLSERSQDTKGHLCMIPFLWNFQNGQIYRDRKEVNCYLGLEAEGKRRVTVSGYRIFLGGYQDVLKLWWWSHNSVIIRNTTALYTFNGRTVWYVNCV